MIPTYSLNSLPSYFRPQKLTTTIILSEASKQEMDEAPRSSGDSTNLSRTSRSTNLSRTPRSTVEAEGDEQIIYDENSERAKMGAEENTFKTIDEHEAQLKNRIDQCRNIIDTLKKELHEEKNKLEKETKNSFYPSTSDSFRSDYRAITLNSTASSIAGYDLPCDSGLFTSSVEYKLGCDENLIEYDKQLQRYQNTLNMAQKEKKNAIRKQMLSKAYKLKLLEVENQCNIELLRVKQSLQCLEPLHMIANSWKDSKDEDIGDFDFGKMDLWPRYPDSPVSDRNSIKDEGQIDTKSIAERVDSFIKDDISYLDT